MALSRVKTWGKERLFYQDLNAEFDNLLNNALSQISPLTGSLDCNGNDIIIDGDGDSKWEHGTDDVTTLVLQAFDAFIFDGDVGTPVNGLTFASTPTGVAPTITGHGETHVSINLVPKGANGVVQIAGETLAGACYDGSKSWNFIPNAGEAVSTTITVTGAALGDFVFPPSVAASASLTTNVVFWAVVTAANTVTITGYNDGGSGINITTTFYVRVLSRI